MPVLCQFAFGKVSKGSQVAAESNVLAFGVITRSVLLSNSSLLDDLDCWRPCASMTS